jgi:hypothetical protein
LTKHTILFLAANPFGTDRLALDQEARAIHAELERSGHRDRFEFVTRWASEPIDLLRELRKLKPTIVHFCGRGGQNYPSAVQPNPLRGGSVSELKQQSGDHNNGLYFQGIDRAPQFVSAAALKETFGSAGASVKLVVLSACYSEVQAEALLVHIDFVVGMTGSIRDAAARSFAIGFYGGLGECASVEMAYHQGRAAISLEGSDDANRPQLKVRNGADAARFSLTEESQAKVGVKNTLVGASMAPMPITGTSGYLAAYMPPSLAFNAVSIWSVGDSPWTIGRDPEGTFVLAENAASRLHGCIEKDAMYRMHVYLDKSSTNGSVVNGLYVRRAFLHTGDMLKVPGAHLYYYLDTLDRSVEIEDPSALMTDAMRLRCIGAGTGLFTVVRLRNFSELASAFELRALRAISEHLACLLAQQFPFSRIEAFRNGFECILITSDAEHTYSPEVISQALNALSVAEIGNGRSVSLEVATSSSYASSDDALAAITHRKAYKKQSARTFNWIHLSDLHLGASIDGWKMDHQRILSAIMHDLRRRRPRMHFDKMFVTGDISSCGAAEEYAQAMDALRSLAAVCDLSLEQVRLVPGNHDVQRGLAGSPVSRALHLCVRQQEDLLDQYLIDERARGILLEKLSTFLAFVNGLPGHPKARDGLDWIEDCPFGDHVIKVFGLSSVWVSDSLDGRTTDRNTFSANMTLSPRAVTEINNHREMNEATIILSHHPRSWLMPRSRRLFDETMTANGALHLCGHSHTPEYSKRDAAGAFANAVMNAGVLHADPAGPPVHTYSWGALKWDGAHQRWLAGWSPRVFVAQRGEMRPDTFRYDLDDDGFAWLPLPSREAPVAKAAPIYDPFHTLTDIPVDPKLKAILNQAIAAHKGRRG